MRLALRLALLIAIAACATKRPSPTNLRASTALPCDGDEYVEVSNFGAASVEVYAYISGSTYPAFVGTARGGTTNIPLAATRALGKPARFVAQRADGLDASAVRLRRWCQPQGT